MGIGRHLPALVCQFFLLAKEDFSFKHNSQKGWAATQTPAAPPSLENGKHQQAISSINDTAAVNAVFSPNTIVRIYIVLLHINIYCPTIFFPVPMSPACEVLALLGISQALKEQESILPSHFPDTPLKEPRFFDPVSFFILFCTLEKKRLNTQSGGPVAL